MGIMLDNAWATYSNKVRCCGKPRRLPDQYPKIMLCFVLSSLSNQILDQHTLQTSHSPKTHERRLDYSVKQLMLLKCCINNKPKVLMKNTSIQTQKKRDKIKNKMWPKKTVYAQKKVIEHTYIQEPNDFKFFSF